MLLVDVAPTASKVAAGAKDAADKGVDAAAQELSILAQVFSKEQIAHYIFVGIRIAVLLLIIFVCWRIIRFALHRFMKKQTVRAGRGATREMTTMGHLFDSILSYTMLFFAIVGMMSIVGFDMRGLVASAGIAGVLVAFVSQSIIKDWVNGLFIILEHQHQVGEWVRIGTYEGEVLSVGIRSTVVRTWKNETIYIPNGSITQVVNLSKVPQRGVLDIGVGYEASNQKARAVLQEVCDRLNQECREALAEPIAILGIQDLGANAVVWRVAFTATDQGHFGVLRRLRAEMKDALDSAGISIPYPQLTVHHEGPLPAKENDDAH